MMIMSQHLEMEGLGQQLKVNNMNVQQINDQLIEFLSHSSCGECAVESMMTTLKDNGFDCYDQTMENLNFKTGASIAINYYGNMVVAVKIPENLSSLKFKVIASHNDVPLLKVCHNGLEIGKNYTLVHCDTYGGVLKHPWFDRPLKLVGRVMVEKDGMIESKVFDSNCAIGCLPSLAIHYQRNLNTEGFKVDNDNDLRVMIDPSITSLESYVANLLNIDADNILHSDYYFASAQKGMIYGDYQWIQADHLDDMMCGYTTMQGLLDATVEDNIAIFVSFDSEEIGSKTLAGAFSTHFKSLLEKITSDLGYTYQQMIQACNQSLLISADNAHATHTTASAIFGTMANCYMNQGIVIKQSTRKAYASEAYGSAALKQIMRNANIDYQEFENKPGVLGGGTLGCISMGQISIPTVDIGAAQMAMHSINEMAGCQDVYNLYLLAKVFFSKSFHLTGVKQ